MSLFARIRIDESFFMLLPTPPVGTCPCVVQDTCKRSHHGHKKAAAANEHCGGLKEIQSM